MRFVSKIRNSLKSKHSEKLSSEHEDHDTVATSDESFGGSSLSQVDQAEDILLDKALQLCEQGRALDSEADLAGALECFQEALVILDKLDVQSTNVTKCETYERLGYITYKKEEYAKSRAYFDKAQEMRKEYPHADESKREEIEYLMEMVEMMMD